MGKGEIARYEQFLLFLQCFLKDVCCRQVVHPRTDEYIEYQSIENTGVAFVKQTNERNEFFEKINKQ